MADEKVEMNQSSEQGKSDNNQSGMNDNQEKSANSATPEATEKKKVADQEKTEVKAKPSKEKPVKEKKPEIPVRRFTLSSSPHIRDTDSVQKIMSTVTITLLPAILGAAWIFGFRALMLIFLGMAGAIITEWVLQKLFGAKTTVADGSAMLTGLLLSFNLPAGVPWWIPVVGSVFAISIAKLPFGGLGYNPLNPALAGRAFLLASWPLHMTKDWLPAFWWKGSGYGYFAWKVEASKFLVDGQSYATPLEVSKSALTTIKSENVPELVAAAHQTLSTVGDLLFDLIKGNVGGCIGETSALLILIGAAYLLYKNYIDWRTPFSFIGVVAIGGWIFGGTSFFTGDMMFHIFAGGLILGAFYMATDMVTSPITPKGRLIFGAGCGLITLMIRMIGGYPEGVSYAILLMNLTVPLIDRWFVPKRFGHKTIKAQN
ncbi:MAG: RnfABCDGE type electron transport complex subunit D [Candidatus Electryonea clarkiae]|nr:RnfABCDGE type electron transport complex subunit D [Candidatus Electryonea clarkiae]MDP8286103.1 RnfABCDGE type electron transport complex subunit D [Candidatus Electryonea clarkiae]